jgi:hypothetical protein
MQMPALVALFFIAGVNAVAIAANVLYWTDVFQQFGLFGF